MLESPDWAPRAAGWTWAALARHRGTGRSSPNLNSSLEA